MNSQSPVTRESPLRQLFLQYGVSQGMLDAAQAALAKKAMSSPFQYRTDIVVAGILGAGIYVLAAVAGNTLHPLSALVGGAALVLLFKLIDRSAGTNKTADCEELLFLSRFGIDFSALALDLYQIDAALAEDLKTVLQVGHADPNNLSEYSILHLWECIRIRALEHEAPLSDELSDSPPH